MAGTPRHERARLANAARWHPDDHEAITAARADLKAAGLQARIREAVATWPPLTPETRAELALLLSPDGAPGAP
jgi:hypothetical protein